MAKRKRKPPAKTTRRGGRRKAPPATAAADTTAAGDARGIQLDPKTIDDAALFLITLRSQEATAAALGEMHAGDPETIAAYIDAARRRIAAAAGYDVTRELGVAIERLNDLYRRAISAKDERTALQAERERIKLLDLGRSRGPDTQNEAHTAAAELAAVREHLAPLDLAPEGTPTAELARLAVAAFCHQQQNAPA